LKIRNLIRVSIASGRGPGPRVAGMRLSALWVASLAALALWAFPLQSPASTTFKGVESVELTMKWGFRPMKIAHSGGPCYFFIRNTTGLAGLELKLNGSAGATVKDWPVPAGQKRVLDTLDLAPDTYTLSVVNHPEWSFTLVMSN